MQSHIKRFRVLNEGVVTNCNEHRLRLGITIHKVGEWKLIDVIDSTTAGFAAGSESAVRTKNAETAPWLPPTL